MKFGKCDKCDEEAQVKLNGKKFCQKHYEEWYKETHKGHA